MVLIFFIIVMTYVSIFICIFIVICRLCALYSLTCYVILVVEFVRAVVLLRTVCINLLLLIILEKSIVDTDSF